jgi:phosphoadenosine phosphosulfate reductase
MDHGHYSLESARTILSFVRGQTDAVGVAYSAGKDSEVVLDLAKRFGFARIEAYHAYKVPDLKIVREFVRRAERRYGIEVRLYPWFTLSKMFRGALLMPHRAALARLPLVGQVEIEDRFRAEASISWILMGWRSSDSLSRAMILRQNGGIDEKHRRAFPLHRWRRGEVFSYLKVRRIPIPESFGRREQGGLDLHRDAVSILRKYYPEDYRRYLEVFPYAKIYEIDAARDNEKGPEK